MCVVATEADPLLTAAGRALKLMLPEINGTRAAAAASAVSDG